MLYHTARRAAFPLRGNPSASADTFIVQLCSLSFRETVVKLMATKDKYSREFFRCCNELGLSPQSRAKFANLMSAKAEDPLIAALAEVDDDEDEDDE